MLRNIVKSSTFWLKKKNCKIFQNFYISTMLSDDTTGEIWSEKTIYKKKRNEKLKMKKIKDNKQHQWITILYWIILQLKSICGFFRPNKNWKLMIIDIHKSFFLSKTIHDFPVEKLILIRFQWGDFGVT